MGWGERERHLILLNQNCIFWVLPVFLISNLRHITGILKPNYHEFWDLKVGANSVKSWYESKSPRTRSTDVWEQEKMDVSPQAKSKFALPLPFCSLWALSGLDDAHLNRVRWSLFSLLIQMLISSRDNRIDTPRSNILPAIWISLSPVKLAYKINHHTTKRLVVRVQYV